MKIDARTLLIIALVGAAGYALYTVKKKGVAGAAADVGAAVGEAVVQVGVGAVEGVGQAVGIPKTDMTECQKAIAEGRTWDASFSCPAGTFITDAVPAAASDTWSNIKSLF